MASSPDLPAGFAYHPDFVDEAEERRLLASIAGVEFSEVRMRGAVARRRTAHFGFVYAYESWRISPGPPLPEFLAPLRERAARLGGVAASELVEVLITEYPEGAGIGWHRDAPMFGVVVGVSLLGECRFRLRRSVAGARPSLSVTLAPRSAYVLDGATRWAWHHSIPPTRSRRYSITFRTLRRQARAAGAH